MVVGDMVTGISLLNTILSFQPAAGVEVVIICASDSAVTPTRFDNGVNVTGQTLGGATNLVKMGITNALFLHIDAVTGGFAGFSGIQTQ